MRILRKGFTRIETLNQLFKLCDTSTLPDPGRGDLSTLHYTCRWEATRAAAAAMDGDGDGEGCGFKLVVKIRCEGREMNAYTVGRHVHSRRQHLQRVCSEKKESLTKVEELGEENVTPPPSTDTANGCDSGLGRVKEEEEMGLSDGENGGKAGEGH